MRKLTKRERFARKLAGDLLGGSYPSNTASICDKLSIYGWSSPSDRTCWAGAPNGRDKTKWREYLTAHPKGATVGGRIRWMPEAPSAHSALLDRGAGSIPRVLPGEPVPAGLESITGADRPIVHKPRKDRQARRVETPASRRAKRVVEVTGKA